VFAYLSERKFIVNCNAFCHHIKGSDHLQLNKFWLSGAPGKGVCGGAKIFVSALLQPARSVCVSSERFFHWNYDHVVFSHIFSEEIGLSSFYIFDQNLNKSQLESKMLNNGSFEI